MILEDRDETEQPKQRRRRSVLAGCLVFVLALLLILSFVGYYYVGTPRFAEFVRKRVERNLESHLQRDVTIGRVRVIRSYPARIIIEDLHVANVPGGVARDFALVRQIEIVGGIQSFATRTLDLGKIYVRGARINFEIYPEDHPLDYNWPKWIRSRPRRFEITRMYLDKLFISGVDFYYHDMRRDMRGEVRGISSEVSAKFREGIYQGIATAPSFLFRIQDYETVTADLRASFYYSPGSLALRSVALRGRGLEAFINGKIDPLTDAVYDLGIVARTDLARSREVFRVERPLAGPLALDMRLRGKAGQYHLTGDFTAPAVTADVYDLADLRGKLNITDQEARIRFDTGKYGGGTISADYVLTKYAEPYPMNVVLDYRSVSLEKLFEDWEVHNLGLRGAATGELTYFWNKDLVLEGRGRGQAQLRPGTVAFGDATYPQLVGGQAVFALNRGVVTFAPSTLRTQSSEVGFAGSFAIESTVSDLRMNISSRDFAELDRIGFNVARSADKKDYELLGLGGSGTIAGTVRGPLDAPDVVAKIVAQRGMFNNVALGDGELELRYGGKSSVLTFDRALFRDEGGTIAMTGTVAFPDLGPPILDLEVTAEGYSVERAMKVVELDLIARGTGTGSLHITGTPDNGKVTFENLRIARNDSQLRLNGDVDWAPGEGNVVFDLDVGADSFPVEDVAAFLEFGPIPVTGEVTGTLHLEGHKSNLQGAGSVIVRNGSIYGEPVDIAMADLLFTEGVMRATHFEVRAPAGTIAGEAEVSFANETFSYVIRSSQIDPTKLKAFAGLSGIFSGPVVISSSGAGPFKRPEIVFEAFSPEGTFLGRPFPEGEVPKVYFAIRDGQITVQGGAFGLFSIDGSGLIAENNDLSGAVRVTISDMAGFLRTFAPDAEIPAEGNLVVDFQLGGNTGALERIEVAGTIPVFNLSVAGQPFTLDPPARFGLRNGRVEIEHFTLVRDGATFSVEGGLGLTGTQDIGLSVRGVMDAALLQIFMPDFRARGKINVAAKIGGTMSKPQLNGSGELLNAQLKISGFPQLIDDINGRIDFEGNRIVINSLRAVVGGGNVNAGGTIYLDGLKVTRFTIPVTGTNVALRYFEGLTLDGDFELVLSGDLQHSKLSALQGEITVDRAVYTRDFDAAQAVLNLLLERRGLVPEVAASWQNNVMLRIKFSAPGTLAVRNNVADVTGSAEFDVGGTLANPILLGDVEIDEGGKIRFQDVDYRVTRGTVAFQNPFRIDPFFDITAEGRVQEYELTVNLSGTIERIHTSITSDPPVSDLTLLSLLGPSDIGQQRSTALMGTDSLQRAGTSLLYSSLGGAIGRRILPFTDSFRLDAGMVEGSSSPEPTVTFEKQISNVVRVIVVYNTADHKKDRQIVEWQATPQWVLQLTREGDEDYRVEARFRRRYEGYWGGSRADTELSSTPVNASGDFTLPRTPDPLAPGESARVRHQSSGTPVVAIDFRTDAPYDPAHLPEHIPLKVGAPLTIRGLQDAISRLYATGDFRDIRVDSTAGEGGLSLTFVLSLNYRVSEVKIVGAGRSREDLLRRAQVRVGDVLSLSRVDRGAELVRKRLGDLGYLEAVVDPETKFFRATNRAEILYHVERGDRADIGTVEFTGDTGPFTQKQLADATRSRPGWVFRRTRLDREVERVGEFLAKKGYRRADVRLLSDQYDKVTNLVNLRYSVDLGPKVEVRVEGVPQRSVRRLLPMRGSERYSTDAIDRASSRIIAEYQRRGHFRVAVDTEEQATDGHWLVKFKVDPGPRYELSDVLFEGNQKLTDNELGDAVATAPAGGIRKLLASLLRRGLGVTSEQLEGDRDTLEAYYRLRGFPDVQIENPVVRTRPEGTMDVVFALREGPQTIVREVIVEGNEKFRLEDLPDLQLQPGQPYNQQIVAADIVALQNFYADRGYVELQVSPLPSVSADKTAASVTYRILEGPEVKVDGISVRGNTYTDREVILRSAGLRQGRPFSYLNILSAQRDLYRLGIFRRVDLIPEAAGTEVTDRDVVIEVEEGRNFSVAGSVGFSSDERATFSGSVAHRNLFGTARYLGLETRISQETNRYFLTYREPFTFNTSIPTQLTLFRTEEQNRPEARIKSWGTFVEASKVLHETTRWALRYEYKIATCVKGGLCDAASGDIPIPEVPREEQEIDISSITPSWFWDRRDDPFTPRRGWLSSASLEYAFPFLSATAEFLKGFGQASWYRPVSDRSEIVLSSRVGLIHPQSGKVVPFSERFVAGGETSNRAFDFDELGIEGQTLVCIDSATGQSVSCADGGRLVPLGGNALALLNAEYRFPIFGALRGALFVDAGNVWRGISDFDFGEFRYGTGLGLRYLTPVGPLRVDFGYKLDREPWEDAYAISITIGYPF